MEPLSQDSGDSSNGEFAVRMIGRFAGRHGERKEGSNCMLDIKGLKRLSEVSQQALYGPEARNRLGGDR